MSMICNLKEIAPRKIEPLLADPDTIEEHLYSEEGNSIDLDKAWHGIHFMLTGSKSRGEKPLCFLLDGGEFVGDIDVGYGIARLLTPSEVREFESALNTISKAEFETRFDSEALTRKDIYPNIWDEGDEALAYLSLYFDTLKSFIQSTCQNENGLLIWLN